MKYFLYILLTVAVFSLGFLAGKGRIVPVDEPEVKIDTVYRVDTFKVEKPVYFTKYVTRIDTVCLRTVDSVFVDVPVPIETKVYEDSSFRAQVTGYNATLDWVEVFPKTAIVTVTKTVQLQPKRFGFDVTVGPAIVFNGGVHAGIGATWGLSYRF